jgi:colicin import membrane protein
MNTETPTVIPPGSELHAMPRADLPAIWEGFREQLFALKSTAETITVTDASQKAQIKLAKETRLTLKDLRVSIEKRRKELGDHALRTKQKIDESAKALKDAIEPLEERLLEQEKFVERQEAERRAALKAERAEQLRPYANPDLFNLPDMSASEFENMFATMKGEFEQRKRVARQQEAERQEREANEAAERLRINMENSRLKREAEKRDAELRAERERVEAERRAAEETARKEREAIEAKAKAEREAIERQAAAVAAAAAAKAAEERRAVEAQAAKEREAREKAEAELAKKKREEDEARKAAENAAKKAAAAPDKEKLEATLHALCEFSFPNLSTPDAKAIADATIKSLMRVSNELADAIAAL